MQDESNVRSSPELIAWAAGLFEGEGTIAARKQSKGKTGVQMRLGMTDRDVVERFRDAIGAGNIYIHKPGTGSWKPVHTWCLYEASKVVEVAELLLPWLGERRTAKAMEVLEIARNVLPHYGKRTHCPEGHPYDDENTVYEWRLRGETRQQIRRCKICRTIQSREKMRRRKGITPDRYRIKD